MKRFLSWILSPVMLIAGLFAHAPNLPLGSDRTPPANVATTHFNLRFRSENVALLLVAGIVLALVLTALQASHGTLAAVGVLLSLFTLPSIFPSRVWGMALTAERDTQARDGIIVTLPMAASTKIYLGGIVASDASGNAKPGADTAGLRAWGRAEQTVDNTAGAAGALTINVRRGVFKYKNSATQAVTAAYKDKFVYVEDDETVAISTTNKIIAGRVVEVASDGVWVDTTGNIVAAAAVTTVGAALSAITGGESPTEAEHNAVITQLNLARTDIIALAAKINAG